MILAIVGSSKLDERETKNAQSLIEYVIKREMGKLGYGSHKLTVITGDAEGIDALVRIECKTLGVQCIVEQSRIKRWNGSGGYRDRNVRIGKKADFIYSFATKVKDMECFHCKEDDPDMDKHQRTGGCWTRHNAVNNYNKKGETLII